jgi:hypothetical protein
MLTWIVICLAVAGWLALDWWMGWTAPKLDAAIRELEAEQRRGAQMQPVDWAVLGFGVVSILIFAAINFGLV